MPCFVKAISLDLWIPSSWNGLFFPGLKPGIQEEPVSIVKTGELSELSKGVPRVSADLTVWQRLRGRKAENEQEPSAALCHA